MDLTSPHGIPVDVQNYAGFRGIDRSRSITALESPEQQALWECYNATCDWRSNIRREDPLRLLKGSSNRKIQMIKFWDRESVAFSEIEEGGVSLNSDRQHRVSLAYDPGALVFMTVYRGELFAMCQQSRMYKYDGFSWSQSAALIQPAFGVPILERLYVHDPSKPTEILASRVKRPDVFPDDEDPESTEATKAAFIDIRNLIGTADRVTALGNFEINRLVIFTNDQTVVYKVDPDFNQWQLDSRANVRVGCVGPRAIANVGSDLIFCSRHGVHSLMRSEQNGVTISEITLSNQIENLYKKMIAKVRDVAEVNCTYDQDAGELHIWFPLFNGYAERLTLSLRGGYEHAKWSQGNSLDSLCGDFLAGRFIVGTPGGCFEYIKVDGRANAYTEGTAFRGKMDVAFPILYHGDFRNNKESARLTLHASGNANLLVRAYDEEGTELNVERFEISASEEEDESIPYNPLESTYEIFFQYRYRGVQVRIETEEGDTGDVRIYSIAFDVVKPPKGK